MTDLAIRGENLSKLYHIGPRERYKTLRDTVTDTLYAPFRALATVFSGVTAHRSSVVRRRSALLCPRSSVFGRLTVLRRPSSWAQAFIPN